LITAASLRENTYKDLAQMAKKQSIRGWHAMRKDQLVRALVQVGKPSRSGQRASGKSNGSSLGGKDAGTNESSGGVTTSGRSGKRRIHRRLMAEEQLRDLAQTSASGSRAQDKRPVKKDRLIVLVRDPYWLHVFWQITRLSVERARSAMAESWHGSQPVLRLLAVDDRSASNMAETVLREIPVHSGVNHWYIDLHDPPGTYRVDIGYRGCDQSFYCLARSNVVTPPLPGSRAAVDENWNEVAEDCEKIYAQSGGCDENGKGIEVQEILEERLRRPLGSPLVTRYGAGATRLLLRESEFDCDVDCELIVFGATEPDAYVTLEGEPVKLRSDGSFTVRLKLLDKRQVIPIVAESSDGLEQRTTILAVERNTKKMEPITRDPNG